MESKTVTRIEWEEIVDGKYEIRTDLIHDPNCRIRWGDKIKTKGMDLRVFDVIWTPEDLGVQRILKCYKLHDWSKE